MMTWIVVGSKNDKVALVSKSDIDAILPKGSYLTIEDGKRKHILRVDETVQYDTYASSPMIVDMDLSPLVQDQKCQNLMYASRITESPERDDGNSSFIKPQMTARKANQEEVYMAFGNKNGMPVFPATVFARNCQNLRDDRGNFIHVTVPDDVFFHQILITGSTGSGKTVAMRYMAQYFLENFEKEYGGGAVLAVNVKEEDLLKLDKPSTTTNTTIKKEWSNLSIEPHGVETFRIYYPGSKAGKYSKAVDTTKCEKITLKTENIDPETLSGLIQNISDAGAEQLPAIFRYWQKRLMRPGDKMNDFIRYFGNPENERMFELMNLREEELPAITMHYSTYQNVNNALTYACEYFDIACAKELVSEDIIQRGKFSVIDVTSKHGFGFGSVLLRDLLEKIYDTNSQKSADERIPILIIIDEVHEFYKTAKSHEALKSLDVISRKGRSLKIGVIFASQNIDDMPKGISSVVNTKIYFKSDISQFRSLGLDISGFDPEGLKQGYAITKIHGLSQLKLAKFPLSLSGVIDGQ